MSLSSLHLDAFFEVAKHKSFSQAGLRLNITQSALSQRVLNLEEHLGSSLFIRDPAGLRLTDLGQKLLRYCHSKNLLEEEFMETLKPKDQKGLSGLVRVGGFSTVGRSVLLPTFAEFLKEHPLVRIETRTEELRELPPLLFSGAMDMIVVNQPIQKQGIENELLGYEEYVLVQSKLKYSRNDVYLDHDEEDQTTYDFFKAQSKKTPVIKRNFVGDIYGILDCVRFGMGRGVVPLHMIKDLKGIEVVGGFTSLKVPVHLCYFTQAFYTELQLKFTERIKQRTAEYLS